MKQKYILIRKPMLRLMNKLREYEAVGSSSIISGCHRGIGKSAVLSFMAMWARQQGWYGTLTMASVSIQLHIHMNRICESGLSCICQTLNLCRNPVPKLYLLNPWKAFILNLKSGTSFSPISSKLTPNSCKRSAHTHTLVSHTHTHTHTSHIRIHTRLTRTHAHTRLTHTYTLVSHTHTLVSHTHTHSSHTHIHTYKLIIRQSLRRCVCS